MAVMTTDQQQQPIIDLTGDRSDEDEAAAVQPLEVASAPNPEPEPQVSDNDARGVVDPNGSYMRLTPRQQRQMFGLFGPEIAGREPKCFEAFFKTEWSQKGLLHKLTQVSISLPLLPGGKHALVMDEVKHKETSLAPSLHRVKIQKLRFFKEGKLRKARLCVNVKVEGDEKPQQFDVYNTEV